MNLIKTLYNRLIRTLDCWGFGHNFVDSTCTKCGIDEQAWYDNQSM